LGLQNLPFFVFFTEKWGGGVWVQPNGLFFCFWWGGFFGLGLKETSKIRKEHHKNFFFWGGNQKGPDPPTFLGRGPQKQTQKKPLRLWGCGPGAPVFAPQKGVGGQNPDKGAPHRPPPFKNPPPRFRGTQKKNGGKNPKQQNLLPLQTQRGQRGGGETAKKWGLLRWQKNR